MTGKENEWLLGEISERESCTTREAVSLRKRGNQRFDVNALHPQPAVGISGRTLQDADVDAPVAKGFGLLQRVHLEEREANAGQVHSEEPKHIGENPGVGRRVHEANTKPSRLTTCGALRGALSAFGLG